MIAAEPELQKYLVESTKQKILAIFYPTYCVSNYGYLLRLFKSLSIRSFSNIFSLSIQFLSQYKSQYIITNIIKLCLITNIIINIIIIDIITKIYNIILNTWSNLFQTNQPQLTTIHLQRIDPMRNLGARVNSKGIQLASIRPKAWQSLKTTESVAMSIPRQTQPGTPTIPTILMTCGPQRYPKSSQMARAAPPHRSLTMHYDDIKLSEPADTLLVSLRISSSITVTKLRPLSVCYYLNQPYHTPPQGIQQDWSNS